MAYREVTMFEIKEVVRLWLAGTPKKRIARQLGVDPKTVRRYVAAAVKHGLRSSQDESALTEEVFADLLLSLERSYQPPHGQTWQRCEKHRVFIAKQLRHEVRLTKIRKLLLRQGTDIPYATLHRFCVAELGFGRGTATIPVADGKPGEEIQLDTGWMIYLEPDLFGKRRRLRAWIFTPSVSRYRFVSPCFKETTASAIEACEAAWEFYGGVFRVVIPDNTKAIVDRSDPTDPRLNRTFLEYAQARGFHIDPARARSPRDKARVERSVRFVRDDCFGGEHFYTEPQAREHARHWCREEAGMRRCRSTYRLPREHFEAEEKAHLLPAPSEPYDIPLWCEPKVGRDQLAQVDKALYSLPTDWRGQRLLARADRHLVRFYHGNRLIKSHLRQRPGGRAIDPTDFPEHKSAYALRDVAYLQRCATDHGEVIGRYAAALLDTPLPWTRMRSVYALLGLVRRYGIERVTAACERALDAEIINVRRLKRIITLDDPAATSPSSQPRSVDGQIVPPARYLRPASQYAIAPSSTSTHTNSGGDS